MSHELLQQALASIRTLDGKINSVAGSFRQQLTAQQQRSDQALSDLAKIADHMVSARSGRGGLAGEANTVSAPMTTGRTGVCRIEDIPGRRVPYTALVEIPIGTEVTSPQEQSYTVSQDGPFVATKCIATFLSQYAAVFTDPDSGEQTRITGRSNGRFRPIHSAGDVVDSQHGSRSDYGTWLTALGAQVFPLASPLPSAVFTPPASSSSFRTMEFDGLIEIINAGSSYPRQNRPTPSAFWKPNILELGALDFFERGEVITWRVQPTHPNNPSFGNVSGECIFPLVPGTQGTPFFPFVEGQFDPHEGICTPDALTKDPAATITNGLTVNAITADPISRLPEGILYIGYVGYRIVQPAGPTM